MCKFTIFCNTNKDFNKKNGPSLKPGPSLIYI